MVGKNPRLLTRYARILQVDARLKEATFKTWLSAPRNVNVSTLVHREELQQALSANAAFRGS